jgi:hypothetical protein
VSTRRGRSFSPRSGRSSSGSQRRRSASPSNRRLTTRVASPAWSCSPLSSTCWSKRVTPYAHPRLWLPKVGSRLTSGPARLWWPRSAFGARRVASVAQRGQLRGNTDRAVAGRLPMQPGAAVRGCGHHPHLLRHRGPDVDPPDPRCPPGLAARLGPTRLATGDRPSTCSPRRARGGAQTADVQKGPLGRVKPFNVT